MPYDNESPRARAQPWPQPDPGMMMNMLLEVPETMLLMYQQMLAGAPTAPWDAQWRQVVFSSASSPSAGASQPSAFPEYDEAQQQHFTQEQVDVADFCRRTLQSFRRGLVMPPKDRRG